MMKELCCRTWDSQMQEGSHPQVVDPVIDYPNSKKVKQMCRRCPKALPVCARESRGRIDAMGKTSTHSEPHCTTATATLQDIKVENCVAICTMEFSSILP
jgi:hypothetical protein